MDLTFLGIGAAFNPAMDNSNAYFVVDEDFFLIDCGESTFSRIWKFSELENARNITVIITHLHADHVGSLGSLISYTHFVLKKKITVVHPQETIVQLLDLMGVTRETYEYLSHYPASPQISFEPVEVEHVPNMTCYGYLIRTPGKNLFYSGDAIRIPEKILSDFRSGRIERIYQDTSIESSDHPTHGSLAQLEALFSREERSRVVCIHLDRDYRAELKEKGFAEAQIAPYQDEFMRL